MRENKASNGLVGSSDFYHFTKNDFDFYSRLYLKIDKASTSFETTLANIYYLEERGFARSFYFPLLTASITELDDERTIRKKLALTSRFLETFLVYRAVNGRTLAYSSIRYTMFSLIKAIRNRSATELAGVLKDEVKHFDEKLDGIMSLALHGQNRRFIHFLLARITRHIEEGCGVASSFVDYVNKSNNPKRFEIEHIWSDKFEEHRDEFAQILDFQNARNKIGDLILIPGGFNQSYGSLPYEQKLPHYYGQNLLARTLSPTCYENNPSFLRYVDELKLPLRPYGHFKHKDIMERQRLYQRICEQIWNLDAFDEIANS